MIQHKKLVCFAVCSATAYAIPKTFLVCCSFVSLEMEVGLKNHFNEKEQLLKIVICCANLFSHILLFYFNYSSDSFINSFSTRNKLRQDLSEVISPQLSPDVYLRSFHVYIAIPMNLGNPGPLRIPALRLIGLP